ncbi:MAG: non-hydrolyzing UDP-N-acetylglucosamine 2-epimerase [Eubacteriaceae bacterium]|nr:hypothetical protein [Eubacteriaceae bacterium]
MKKIMTIFGTRPEAIKMAPLVKELSDDESFICIVCITAQHREMLDQVLNAFNIVPNYDLNIMQKSQTLASITTDALTGLEEIVEKEKPDMILVHGDTTTTFAGAIAAFYHRIPVGHVEAGLRTWNKYSPFPEEMNRQMVDCISELFFAPTQTSLKNLLEEGKKKEKIHITGNTAIDALKVTVKENYSHPELEWVGKRRLLLLTAHRRENFGAPMEQIFRGIRRITEDFENVCVIYPVHLNPAVRIIANKVLAGNEKIHLIEPLDVLDFHNFLNASYLILTDSGGIQEEAPHLGKPVLVLRDTTERPEGVEAGTLKLVGTNEEKIYEEISTLLSDDSEYSKMSKASNPYGDGNASFKIVAAIKDYFNE